MKAVVSNGQGSKYIVRTDTSQICAGTVVLFPLEDKEAFEALKWYYERSDKSQEMGDFIRDCDAHWHDIEAYEKKLC